MFPLSQLGSRICIIGPSNSGKSTLALALGKTLGIPTHHLDQLAHLPHTNWHRRPDADFVHAHDEIIRKESWVVDGNYSLCMPQRFDRSAGVIWLDPPLGGAMYVAVCAMTFNVRAGWKARHRNSASNC